MKQLIQSSKETFQDFVKKLPNKIMSTLTISANIEGKIFIEGKVLVNPFQSSEVEDIANFFTDKLIPFSRENQCVVIQSGVNKDNTYFIADAAGFDKLNKIELLNKLVLIAMVPHDKVDYFYFGEKMAARTIKKKQKDACDCWMDQPIM